MARMENLCVFASIILLVAGIATPYLTPNTGWDIIVGKTSFGLSWQMPLYAVAALFSLIACLYSIRYIPFQTSLVQWHFWLSAGCVVWFVIGQIVLYTTLRGNVPQLGVAGQVLATSFLASILIFLMTQLLFAFALVRALLKMHLP